MSQITVTDASGNATVIVGPDLTPDVVEVIGLGPQGARGPDPWDDPVQFITASGVLVIDYLLGKHVVLTLSGNVTSLTVNNWPTSGKIARATFEIINPSNYNVVSWPGVKWPGGVEPDVSVGGIDLFILATVTGGTRILGNTVGQGYS